MVNERIPRLPNPKAKVKTNRGKKVIFLLCLFFIVLMVVLFFRSSISKIDSIQIRGNQYLTLEEIGQALVIVQGDSFFSASEDRLEMRVKQLANVESVVVVKRFPGQITVKIKEYGEVAYTVGLEGKMNIILSNGNIVSPIKGKSIKLMPVLTGWENEQDNQVQLSEQLSQLPQPLLSDISQIKPEPTAAYPDRIRLYTRSQFEVITTIEYLTSKIDYMRAIISEKDPGEITLLEANTYRSYESALKPDDGSEQAEPEKEL